MGGGSSSAGGSEAPRPRRAVTIEIEPVDGAEPDDFGVVFDGADGVRTAARAGTEATLPAGKVGTWLLQVTVAAPVAPGGGFLFQRRGFLLGHRTQDANPLGRDYVTLTASTGARLRLIVNTANQSHRPGFAQVLVEAGELRPGDSFVVRVGDRRAGGPGSEVYDATTRARFVAAVDRQGRGEYRTLAGSPVVVRITSEPRPDLLRCLGPSVVAPGEPFALHLVVFDPHRNVCAQYAGEVQLSPHPDVVGVPATVRFDAADGGVRVQPDVRLTRPGLYRLGAVDREHGLRATSNPIVCTAAPARRLLWGELHAHSRGVTTLALMDEPSFKLHPAARHRQARVVGRLDFAAPGPMSPAPQEEAPEVWAACQAAYREHDQPGKYVPFLAYEVHPDRGGDRNVVFREWAAGHLPTRSPMAAVMAAYAGREDVVLEAHVGGGPPDWAAYRPAHEPLLEVASGHGAFEWALQQALRYGYRPAVIGSSDAHLTTLGAPMAAHAFRGRFQRVLNVRDTGFGAGPLAAVWAERCERSAIWQAIRERRTFATTGARIILHLTVNGHHAGSEITDPGPVRARIQAHACAPVERVDLIRGDRCLQSWWPAAMDVDLSLTDEAPRQQAAYYVRLRQVDGEHAWSTPVWVACPGGSAAPDDRLPYWNAHEPVDLAALRPNEAEAHEPALRRYLEIEERLEDFQELTPVRLVRETAGEAALFFAYLGVERIPISLRWYFRFEMPRIHLDWGWRDFGMRSGQDIGRDRIGGAAGR